VFGVFFDLLGWGGGGGQNSIIPFKRYILTLEESKDRGKRCVAWVSEVCLESEIAGVKSYRHGVEHVGAEGRGQVIDNCSVPNR